MPFPLKDQKKARDKITSKLKYQPTIPERNEMPHSTFYNTLNDLVIIFTKL
jgi:hypothetical protein